MKFLLLLLSIVFISSLSFGQSKIRWTYVFNTDLKAVEIQADLAEGWHLYSQHVNSSIGPVPTSFSFLENDKIELIGNVNEPKPLQKYDENFEATLDFFEGEVHFSQLVSVKSPTSLKGVVTYMLCHETMCLPPVDEIFTIEISN